MPLLLPFDVALLLDLFLFEVLPHDHRRHQEEQQAGADPDRFSRQQAQQRASRDRHRALDHERRCRPEKDRQGTMAGRQEESGERRLVGQLEQKDDGEDGEAKSEGVGHGGSLVSLGPAPGGEPAPWSSGCPTIPAGPEWWRRRR